MFSVRFLRSIQKIQKPEEAKRFLRLDKYWRPELAEALLTQVDKIVALKPRQALGLAEIGIQLVKRIRGQHRELEAHAFCSLATAQRSLGRFNEADSNYLNAEKLALGGSSRLSAMIHRQKAVLLAEQADLDGALKLVQRAVELDRAAGIFPSKSLIIEAIIRSSRGESDGSEACFKRVLDEEHPDSDDFLFAASNFVASLTQRPLLGTEIVEARKTLRKIQERIRGVRETPVRYFIWGVEGRLHALMEEFRLAVNHFTQARSGFLRLEMIPDFSRVSVDLVDALLKKGDFEKARITVERTAKKIAEFKGHERFAEAFQLGRDEPIEQAAEVIRSYIDRVPAQIEIG